MRITYTIILNGEDLKLKAGYSNLLDHINNSKQEWKSGYAAIVGNETKKEVYRVEF